MDDLYADISFHFKLLGKIYSSERFTVQIFNERIVQINIVSIANSYHLSIHGKSFFFANTKWRDYRKKKRV